MNSGQNARPEEVPIDIIIDYELGGYLGSEKQAVSDVLDIIAFLESEKKDVRQGDLPGLSEREKRYHSGPGGGYYQLERGSEGGGYTRANVAYSRLPKELTPAWLHDFMVEARFNDNTWDSHALSKEDQDFVMVAYLLNDSNSKEVIQNVAKEDDPNLKIDMILNYWLDHHWAGWQNKSNGETVRANKKSDAIQRMKMNYKYDPNWLDLQDNLNYEFNMDNY